MVLERLQEKGTAELQESLTNLFNTLMVIERSQVLAAEPYERSEGRKGHANGFKDKRLLTRSGALE